MDNKKFEPKRLTKKSFKEFIDYQLLTSKDFSPETEEARQEEFDKEWETLNTTLKSKGMNKKKRKNKKFGLKRKYGLVNIAEVQYKKARVALIKSIRNYFILD